jgi:hypothetical protein
MLLTGYPADTLMSSIVPKLSDSEALEFFTFWDPRPYHRSMFWASVSRANL